MIAEPTITEQVLMIVKTYPTPSRKYGELVCTAGIRLRDRQWVRIYPFPFRTLAQDYQFRKWEVLEMPLRKAKGDPRPESYNLMDSDKIKHLHTIGTEDKYWTPRMPFIRETAVPSVRALEAGLLSEDEATWGPSIRPVRVEPGSAIVTCEHVGAEWKADQLAKLQSAKDRLTQGLFVDGTAAEMFQILRKVPYRFYVQFRDMTGETHRKLVLDWEIAMLYFNSRRSVRTDDEALEKVRKKIEDQMFHPKREVYLILGNMHHQYKQRQLAIDGFVWPELKPEPAISLQPSLF